MCAAKPSQMMAIKRKLVLINLYNHLHIQQL